MARLVRGGVLAGLGVLLLMGGETVLARFLSPNVAIRATLGAIVLLVLGGVEIRLAFGQAVKDEAAPSVADGTDDDGSHEHARSHKGYHHSGVGPLWALLLPLVMLPAAVNSSSSNIARNRLYTVPGVQSSEAAPIGGPIPETAEETDPSSPLEDGELPEIAYRLLPEEGDDGVFEFESANFSLLPYVTAYDRDHLLGKRVRLVGFAHREAGWPENSFVLGRLSIWCCTADASLVGMLITVDGPAPERGTWLEVEGTVDIVDGVVLGDQIRNAVPALSDVSLRRVSQPEEEYTVAPVW